MTLYRYLSYDLRTNVLQQELPLRGVSFGGTLNTAGIFGAELPLNVSAQSSPGVYRPMGADYLTASTPGRTIIYVESNGVLIDGFIVWTRMYTPDHQSVALGGLSVWSYFGKRVIDVDLSYVDYDQLAIARTIVTQMQTNTGGNIGVAVGAETCGVLRKHSYFAYENKYAGEAVEQLSQLNNGFDFGIDVAYDGAKTPVKTFRCSYPRRGRIAGVSGHVFETGRNIIHYNLPEDATQMADRVFAAGAGDGLDMLRTTVARTDIVDQGYPLLDGVIAYKDVSDLSTLIDHAWANVNAHVLPVTIPTITVLADGDPPLGGWIVGDDATFVFGTDPAKPDARFPTRTELIWRIVGYRATPGNEGQQTVDLIVN